MRIIPELKEGTHRAKATGTLPNGKPVVVNSDGTVSVVGGASVSSAIGTPVVFDTGDAFEIGICFDSTNNKVVIVYRDGNNSNFGTAIVGTVSGTSISFGTPVVYNSATTTQNTAVFDSSNAKVVVGYTDNGNSSHGTSIVGTVSGTSISFGSEVVFSSSNTQYIDSIYDSGNEKIIFSYSNAGSSYSITSIVGTVSGTSISFGTAADTGQDGYYTGNVYDPDTGKFVVGYSNSSSSDGQVFVGTVSGTSISYGSAVTFQASAVAENLAMVYDTSNNKVVIAYDNSANNVGSAIVGTVSGTSISFGSFVSFETGGRPGYPAIAYDETAQKIGIFYEDKANSEYGTYIAGTVSGTSITFDTAVVYQTGTTSWQAAVYDSNAKKLVGANQDQNNGGKAVVVQNASTSTNLTSENYIGMSGGVVSSETVTQALGSVVDITNTAPAYIAMAHDESAGKVIVAYKLDGGNEYGYAAVGTVSGTSITFGTPVAYTSSALQSASQSIAYDSVNNKVVISFTLQGGGNRYGTAIVGTVSGDSISFGSAATFNAGVTAWITSVFDSSNNKVVISYSDGGNSDYGTAIVGTVSGTSISFGSEVVFESANSGYLGSAFDSTNNKVVVSYRDDGNTGKGTAIVGTVSGTSISFGTAALFNNASTYWTDTTFDSTNGKAVILYMDDGNSQYGTAIVGTVSGTDITFGSEVVFNTSATTAPVAAFDSGVGKITVAYRNSGNSNNTTIISATVSGTSISFDSAVDVGIVNGGSKSIGIVFDSTNNRNVIAFKDDTANDNSAVVFRNAGTITTRGQVNAGSSATVDIIGSLSTNQLGLTAGQSYYVQTDGTIGETAADPSVFAGTATSATSLVVKT